MISNKRMNKTNTRTHRERRIAPDTYEEDCRIIDESTMTENDIGRWRRPMPPIASEPTGAHANEQCTFFLVDVKTRDVTPHAAKQSFPRCEETEPLFLQTPACGGPGRLLVTLFGVTERGHSIAVDVLGFRPAIFLRPHVAVGPDNNVIDAKLCDPFSGGDVATSDALDALKQDILADLTDVLAKNAHGRANASRKRYGRTLDDKNKIPFYRADMDARVVASRPGDSPTGEMEAFIELTFAAERDMQCAVRHLKTRHDMGLISIRQQRPTLDANGLLPFALYDAHLRTADLFAIDHGMVGAAWVRLATKLARNAVVRNERRTSCQFEYLVTDGHAIRGISPDAEENSPLYERPVPLRILSYDIECKGTATRFPDAELDPIIQIGCLLRQDGLDDERRSKKGQDSNDESCKNEQRILFALDSCRPIPGTRVLCFYSEAELLAAFATFLHHADPDVVLGYNNCAFDDAYVYDRAKLLDVEAYWHCTRDPHVQPELYTDNRSSKQMGNRQQRSVRMCGRVIYDVLPFVRDNYKLRSYTLNATSAHFLNDQKEDLHHSMIRVLQDGDASDRRRLGSYCIKDVLLPIALADKLQSIGLLVEFSRVTGSQMNDIQGTGSSHKVRLHLFRQVYADNLKKRMLIPMMEGMEKKSYTGATVIEPMPGYYLRPVATLDFSSLYPSAMIADNICFTTFVPPDAVAFVLAYYQDMARQARRAIPSEDDVFFRCPLGHVYLKATQRQGVLTNVLRRLLDRRAVAKRAMASFKKNGDPHRAAVYGVRQLAIKLLANSVYGFMGLPTNVYFYYCAQSTTALGRQQIFLTQQLITEKFTKANGYESDATIVYGDTDSVMIDFGVNIKGEHYEREEEEKKKKTHVNGVRDVNGDDRAETDENDDDTGGEGSTEGTSSSLRWNDTLPPAFKPSDATRAAIARTIALAEEASEYCTKHFKAPNKLEFENVYWPYLLIRKKRYAGPFWTTPVKADYTKIRGLESERRDNCLAASDAQRRALHFVLYRADPEAAARDVERTIGRLRNGTMDYSRLVITAALSKRQFSLDARQMARIRADAQRKVTEELASSGDQATLQDKNRYRNACRKKVCALTKELCDELGTYSVYNVQAQVDVKRRQRTGRPFDIGDRVPYMIVDEAYYTSQFRRRGDVQLYKRAEDPQWMLQHRLPVDVTYYSEQIVQCCVPVLAPFFEGVNARGIRSHRLDSLFEDQRKRNATSDAPPQRPQAIQPRHLTSTTQRGAPPSTFGKKTKKMLLARAARTPLHRATFSPESDLAITPNDATATSASSSSSSSSSSSAKKRPNTLLGHFKKRDPCVMCNAQPSTVASDAFDGKRKRREPSSSVAPSQHLGKHYRLISTPIRDIAKTDTQKRDDAVRCRELIARQSDLCCDACRSHLLATTQPEARARDDEGVVENRRAIDRLVSLLRRYEDARNCFLETRRICEQCVRGGNDATHRTSDAATFSSSASSSSSSSFHAPQDVVAMGGISVTTPDGRPHDNLAASSIVDIEDVPCDAHTCPNFFIRTTGRRAYQRLIERLGHLAW